MATRQKQTWFRVITMVAVLVLGAAALAGAVDFTVGPAGAYQSLHLALADAVSSGDIVRHVKIQAGQAFNGSFVIGTGMSSGLLLVSGGWNAAFDTQAGGADSSVLEANYGGRVLKITPTGSSYVHINNLTVQEGQVTNDDGGGIFIETDGSASVTVDGCRITGNRAVSSGTLVHGGGISINALTGGNVTIEENEISGNQVVLVGGTGSGHGGAIYAKGAVTIASNDIHGNSCVGDWGPGQTASGCAISCVGGNGRTLEVKGNTVRGSAHTNISTGAYGINLHAECYVATLVEERNSWLGGSYSGSGVDNFSVNFNPDNTCALTLRSSVIAGAAGDGLRVQAFGESVAHLNNLTITDNGGTGLSITRYPSSTGSASVYNTISYGNSGADTNLNDPNLVSGANFFGTDPGFAYPEGGVYSLGAVSPCIDQGYNDAPGGLGNFDAAFQPRVQDGVVDIGAYEGVQFIFGDGFEGGGSGNWG